MSSALSNKKKKKKKKAWAAVAIARRSAADHAASKPLRTMQRRFAHLPGGVLDAAPGSVREMIRRLAVGVDQSTHLIYKQHIVALFESAWRDNLISWRKAVRVGVDPLVVTPDHADIAAYLAAAPKRSLARPALRRAVAWCLERDPERGLLKLTPGEVTALREHLRRVGSSAFAFLDTWDADELDWFHWTRARTVTGKDERALQRFYGWAVDQRKVSRRVGAAAGLSVEDMSPHRELVAHFARLHADRECREALRWFTSELVDLDRDTGPLNAPPARVAAARAKLAREAPAAVAAVRDEWFRRFTAWAVAAGEGAAEVARAAGASPDEITIALRERRRSGSGDARPAPACHCPAVHTAAPGSRPSVDPHQGPAAKRAWSTDMTAILIRTYPRDRTCSLAFRRLASTFDRLDGGPLDATRDGARAFVVGLAEDLDMTARQQYLRFIAELFGAALEVGAADREVARIMGVDPLAASPDSALFDEYLGSLSWTGRRHAEPSLRRMAGLRLATARDPDRGPSQLAHDEVSALFDALGRVGGDALTSTWPKKTRYAYRWARHRVIRDHDLEQGRRYFTWAFERGRVSSLAARAAGVDLARLAQDRDTTEAFIAQHTSRMCGAAVRALAGSLTARDVGPFNCSAADITAAFADVAAKVTSSDTASAYRLWAGRLLVWGLAAGRGSAAAARAAGVPEHEIAGAVKRGAARARSASAVELPRCRCPGVHVTSRGGR